MRKVAALVASLALALSVLVACDELMFKPDVDSIETALGAAVPIAYVGTLAMAAFRGETTRCVDFATDCADPPCGGIVNVLVNDDCPLPLAEGGQGMVTVTGALVNEDTGLFAAVFSDVQVGSRRLILREVRAFIVTRFTDSVFVEPRMDEGIKVLFYDADLDLARDGGLDVAQSQWLVDVATGSTPGDPSDDRMSISGASQEAGSGEERAHAKQTAMVMVEMDATCLRNPVRGYAMIEAVNTTEVMDNGITMLGFHSACDGEANILLSVGTSSLSTGTTVALDLLE
jgi:hypothetical protein